MTRKFYSKHATSYGGFTLIEVLVALLVLSIGLVGLAALQLTALQRAQSSFYVSVATAAALDFEERVWIKLAGESAAGCLSIGDFDDIAADLESQWEASVDDAKRIGIPGFKVTAARGTSTADYVPVDVTLTWGKAGTRIESEKFEYTLRAACRPDLSASDDNGENGEANGS